MSNAQVTVHLKSKNEPARLVERFVEFNQEARNMGLQNAPIAGGVIGLWGFIMSCFLPGGKPKKPTAEPAANAPPASA